MLLLLDLDRHQSCRSDLWFARCTAELSNRIEHTSTRAPGTLKRCCKRSDIGDTAWLFVFVGGTRKRSTPCQKSNCLSLLLLRRDLPSHPGTIIRIDALKSLVVLDEQLPPLRRSCPAVVAFGSPLAYNRQKRHMQTPALALHHPPLLLCARRCSCVNPNSTPEALQMQSVDN